LAGDGPAMTVFQSEYIKGTRQKSHDQREDHSGSDTDTQKGVAVPNFLRIAASLEKNQAPEANRCGPD
jgi:hypothetical protein